MKVMFACVCDHASADAQGKLNVNGIFDQIRSAAFPATHGVLFLVFRLMFEFEDNGRTHVLTVTLIDEDGKEFLNAKGNVDHGQLKPGQFSTFNQIIGFNNLKFMKAGRYIFVLTADGEEAYRVPLDVLKA